MNKRRLIRIYLILTFLCAVIYRLSPFKVTFAAIFHVWQSLWLLASKTSLSPLSSLSFLLFNPKNRISNSILQYYLPYLTLLSTLLSVCLSVGIFFQSYQEWFLKYPSREPFRIVSKYWFSNKNNTIKSEFHLENCLQSSNIPSIPVPVLSIKGAKCHLLRTIN